MQWTPETLARDAGGTLLTRADVSIAGAFIDSRTPLRGGLFVPIIAARDGHDFIEAAVTGGAAAVLVSDPGRVPSGDITVVQVPDTLVALQRLATCRRNQFDGPVVAVSGSNGKTTTRSMIAAVMGSALPSVLCTSGNLNNHLGVPLTLLGEPHWPDGMVIEFGMNAPGENERLAAIAQPTVHVVTSIALEHLEFMKTLEAIAAAEAEPLAHVRPGGAIVVPSDERLLDPYVGRAQAEVVRFGPDAEDAAKVIGVEQRQRTVATIEVGGQRVEVRLQHFGAHNARNAAAALAVGWRLGYALAPMVEALEQVTPVGDRGRAVRAGEHLIVADCYNANPGSMAVALRSFAALRGRFDRLVAVLGDMLELGPEEDRLHADVGGLVGELGLDAVVGVGPRSQHLVEAARAAGVDGVHLEDASAAAPWVAQRLGSQSGAVLVKASRGLRLEQVVNGLHEFLGP